jgi:hypothetical protein
MTLPAMAADHTAEEQQACSYTFENDAVFFHAVRHCLLISSAFASM